MQQPSTPSPGGAFELIDHNGHPVSNLTCRDRYALIFFGFTHCRVVCPRALGKLTAVLEALGLLADRIRPFYITVDPARDTPDVMRSFLAGYPRFTGLTGPPEQIDVAKRNFRVYAERVADPQDPDGYAVPHTAITYLLDVNGHFVDHFTDALSQDTIAARIRSRLQQGAAPRADGA